MPVNRMISIRRQIVRLAAVPTGIGIVSTVLAVAVPLLNRSPAATNVASAQRERPPLEISPNPIDLGLL